MPPPRRNHNKRNSSKNYVRSNERIRAPQVRVIAPDGNQLGVMSPRKAIEIAKAQGLDLVEISEKATPPVCQIIDVGKYKYERSKKLKENKPQSTKLKEVKFRLNIDEHDYTFKRNHAEEFLQKGNKVKASLMLRGREMQFKERAFEVMKRLAKDLENAGNVEAAPRMSGNVLSLYLSPK